MAQSILIVDDEKDIVSMFLLCVNQLKSAA